MAARRSVLQSRPIARPSRNAAACDASNTATRASGCAEMYRAHVGGGGEIAVASSSRGVQPGSCARPLTQPETRISSIISGCQSSNSFDAGSLSVVPEPLLFTLRGKRGELHMIGEGEEEVQVGQALVRISVTMSVARVSSSITEFDRGTLGGGFDTSVVGKTGERGGEN